jgi:hypothetical protein
LIKEIIMAIKACKTCKVPYEDIEENFYHLQRSFDGYDYVCKGCHNKKNAEWTKSHPFTQSRSRTDIQARRESRGLFQSNVSESVLRKATIIESHREEEQLECNNMFGSSAVLGRYEETCWYTNMGGY